jgi:hypothetical protein
MLVATPILLVLDKFAAADLESSDRPENEMDAAALEILLDAERWADARAMIRAELLPLFRRPRLVARPRGRLLPPHLRLLRRPRPS